MASLAIGEEVVSPSHWTVRVWTITTLIVAFALLAQATLILGVSVLEASVTAVVRTLDIPLAMCWAYMLLSEVPEVSQILGSGVLVVACALFAVGSGRNSLTPSALNGGLLDGPMLPGPSKSFPEQKDWRKKAGSNPQA